MKELHGNIVVGQSGGPTAAINATLAGVIRGGLDGISAGTVGKIYGMRNGVEGLLEERLVDLGALFDTDEKLRRLEHTPAAALGSCRKKLPRHGDDPAVYEKLLAIFRKYDIRYFFYIGGNDSMDTAAKLSEYTRTHDYEMRIMGVPKTIDNDLVVTDHTPGFGSAAKYIAVTMQEIIRDCSVYTLPAVTIVEIMGRDAGWLTAASAIGRAVNGISPDLVYLPEHPFDLDAFFARLRERLAVHPGVVVAVSEGIRFADVAGEDEAKENLQEIVNYLHDPSKYQEIGASMPKGILLVGPPGTGKTMLAKAVAGEANVPFFSMSGSEFVEMFVGMGASKVRDLFKQAKEKAPCIVFIDEIDAIGQKRNSGNLGGNDEREQTLNQLLTEMDGFEGNTGVIILAATNRPESLDPALTRPGRFDRRVPVELPDLLGREAILKVHAKKIKIAEDVDFNKIARMASGASGAELANIVNEAALRAVRDGRRFATQADLEESIEIVIAGYQKKNAILTDKEKMIVSYHEIGHALVAAKQTNSAPVQKITIVPRTSGALGYTMQVEEGNHYLMSKEEIENKIATLTGGRVAEEVAVGSVSTGASNDIEQATRLARAMITRYGMSDDFGMVALETVTNQYLGGDATLACSPETQTEIDRKVVELVKKEYARAKDIITSNRGKLEELAKYLYEHETITGEEFMNILNAPAAADNA